MIINATGFQSQSRNRAETGSLFNRDDEKNIKNEKKGKNPLCSFTSSFVCLPGRLIDAKMLSFKPRSDIQYWRVPSKDLKDQKKHNIERDILTSSFHRFLAKSSERAIWKYVTICPKSIILMSPYFISSQRKI
jgi:hypothetical protein